MLEEHGVAVVPGVLNLEECTSIIDGVWRDFKSLCSKMSPALDRNNPATWDVLQKLLPRKKMLYQHYPNHIQSVWDVRQNPGVVGAFQTLYGTKGPMIVSFDGMSFLPYDPNNKCRYTDTWTSDLLYHTDQSLYRPDFECIQGFVTPVDVDVGDGTLAVLPGSHKYHSEFMKWRFESSVVEKAPKTPEQKRIVAGLRNDWYQFDGKDMFFYRYISSGGTGVCVPKCILASAGSLVLWDSRTLHCGKLPEHDRPAPHDRIAIYVCMTPKAQCSQAKLLERIEKFKQLRGTTHWPAKARLFPEHPRTYGAKLPEVCRPPAPVLTGLGMSLVGYSIDGYDSLEMSNASSDAPPPFMELLPVDRTDQADVVV